jgi:hypothetical protein
MFRNNKIVNLDVDKPICDIIHDIRNFKSITPIQKNIILSCSNRDKMLIIETYDEIVQYVNNYIIEESELPNILGK